MFSAAPSTFRVVLVNRAAGRGPFFALLQLCRAATPRRIVGSQSGRRPFAGQLSALPHLVSCAGESPAFSPAGSRWSGFFSEQVRGHVANLALFADSPSTAQPERHPLPG